MVRAQLVANFATRREVSIDDSVEEIDAFVSSKIEKPSPKTRKAEFILEIDQKWLDYMDGNLKYVRSPGSLADNFSKFQNEFYARYLTNLSEALGYFSRESSVAKVMVDRPAVDIQNSIRSHELISDLKLPQILEQDPLILGLAGLSESGKGTIAEELSRKHGFTRLKLGFFNETARLQSEEYFGDPHVIAMNALRFIANNRHLERITFESFYGPHLASEFLTLLGSDRWKTIMLEVPDEVRRQRLIAQFPTANIDQIMEDQDRKDQQKLAQGILEYMEIADLRVDNSGTINQTVDRIIEGLKI